MCCGVSHQSGREGRDGAHPGLGQDIKAHVAASLGPLVGLLGQNRTNETDGRATVEKDPDYVGAAQTSWAVPSTAGPHPVENPATTKSMASSALSTSPMSMPRAGPETR